MAPPNPDRYDDSHRKFFGLTLVEWLILAGLVVGLTVWHWCPETKWWVQLYPPAITLIV